MPRCGVLGLGRFSVLLVSLALSVSASANDALPAVRDGLALLTSQERDILELYLRSMVADSEGAAVLFGDKPVLITGTPMAPCFPPPDVWNRPLFTQAELHRQGIRVWQKLARPASNFIIQVFNPRPYEDDAMLKFAWINRNAFLQVVQDHIECFRMVFGPTITPHQVLARITDPDVDFLDALNQDHVIIGIVLGFGEENSMTHGRLGKMDQLLFSEEQIPMRRRRDRWHGIKGQIPVESLPLGHFGPLECPEVAVDPGYSSLVEEYNALREEYVISRRHPEAEGNSIVWFGCCRGTEETKSLIRRYVAARDKGDELLCSDTFLQDILQVMLQ